MDSLIKRIIGILGDAEGRLTTDEIAEVLRGESWDFGSSDPVYAVNTALLSEKHTPAPRVIQFMGRYTLRRSARSVLLDVPLFADPVGRVVEEPAPTLNTAREDPLPTPEAIPEHDLSGGTAHLLLDLLQGPRHVDHIDGRTVAALVRRNLAAVDGDWVYATPPARRAIRHHLRGLARTSSGRGSRVFSALADLVDGLPQGSEITIRDVPAAAADVLLAIYEVALAADRRATGDDDVSEDLRRTLAAMDLESEATG